MNGHAPSIQDDPPGDSPAIQALIARTAIVVPTYWSRPHGLRRAGDTIDDHPTPVDSAGTIGRLLRSLQGLHDRPRLVLLLISSAAPDLETSAAYQADIVRDSFPDLPIALWTSTHVQILHGTLRSMNRPQWIAWFDTRGYPQVRNLQLLVPRVLDCDLVVALDDDEIVDDPFFLRRAVATSISGDAQGSPVYGAAGHYLDEYGQRMQQAPPDSDAEDPNPFERKIALMNAALERVERQAGSVVPSFFALGGNMTFSSQLLRRIGFDPAIARGEDMDYAVNAHLMGLRYHFDKNRPVRHLPPPGYSYRDVDYLKLQQDVRRFIYVREKLRAVQDAGGFTPLTAADLQPYPGAFLGDDLEHHAVQALRLHRPELFDTSIQEPEAFVARAVELARQGATAFAGFAREWPVALEALAGDRALRHVARGILP